MLLLLSDGLGSGSLSLQKLLPQFLPEAGIAFVFIGRVTRSHFLHCIIPETHVWVFGVGITPDATD